MGVGVVGDLEDRRSTGVHTARWTTIPPKHAASGSGLGAEKMTIPEETTRERATNAGSRATSEPTAFTSYKRAKEA